MKAIKIKNNNKLKLIEKRRIMFQFILRKMILRIILTYLIKMSLRAKAPFMSIKTTIKIKRIYHSKQF
jgi:hypothetical protein